MTEKTACLLPGFLLLVVMSCSGGDTTAEDLGDGEEGTGGEGPGPTNSGGSRESVAATGGAPAATGGNDGTGSEPTGSGAAGAGGTPTEPSSPCPEVLSTTWPTLTGAMRMVVADVPEEFLEGPVWVEDTLYVTRIGSGSPNYGDILKLNGDKFETIFTDVGCNGLAVRADGKLVGASQKYHALILLDPENPSVPPEIIVDQYEGKGFNSPNDVTLRSDGNIYFTDPTYNCGSDCPQGKRRAYRVDPTGEVTEIPTGHNQPNGISLSPDERTLYIAGSDALSSFPVNADGSVGPGATFADGPTSGDGMAIDCAGNVYASTHIAGVSIKVRSPDGQMMGELQANAPHFITNLAFGGPNRTTLYITTHDKQLLAYELDIPGYPY